MDHHVCVYFNRIFKNRIIALIVILCELLILAGVLYWKFVMYCIVMYMFVCLSTCVCACMHECVVSVCLSMCVLCLCFVFVCACMRVCVFVYMCCVCMLCVFVRACMHVYLSTWLRDSTAKVSCIKMTLFGCVCKFICFVLFVTLCLCVMIL